MKILITGAAGFIGSHTAERLAASGFEVTGLDNFSDYYDVNLKLENKTILNNQGIYIINADLFSDNLLNILPTDFDYIFHFAAQPGISSHVPFESYINNNILATHNLLMFAFRNKNLKMFINISTSSVYGFNAIGREDAVTAPVSVYGITKLAAEQLVLKESRMNNLTACSLRLYSVYGPRERPDKLFSRLIEATIGNTAFPLFQGSEKHMRSYTYISDIVDGIVSVIGKESLCNEQIFNLGNDTECSTQYGIDCIKDLLKKEVLTELTAKRSGDQLYTRADITKARKLLGYSPAIALKDGLKKQVAWHRNRLISAVE